MLGTVELRQIAGQTKAQLETLFPDLRMVLVFLTGEPTTPVVATGNLRSGEVTVRLLRELADKIEREGANPTILQ